MTTDDPEVWTVTVEQPSPAAGTLRWLMQHRVRISLVTESGRERCGRLAVLAGESGAELLVLASAWRGQTSVARCTREEASALVPWTDAAWALLSRLVDHAEKLLAEPAWMADAVAVRFEPVSPEAEALVGESAADLAARGVLHDFLSDRARDLGAPPPAADPREWEVPF